MYENTSNQNNELYSPVTRLSERLIEIQGLCALLGYDDMRSVLAWCKKRKVPLIVLGRKTYTISNFLDMYVESNLRKFVDANYANSNEVMDAIRNDDELKPVINKPVVKLELKNKQEISNASKRFLKAENINVKNTGKV
jgi:hypothetical protein